MWFMLAILTLALGFDWIIGASLIWITSDFVLHGHLAYSEILFQSPLISCGVGLIIVVPLVYVWIFLDGRSVSRLISEGVQQELWGGLREYRELKGQLTNDATKNLGEITAKLKEIETITDAMRNIGNVKDIEQLVSGLDTEWMRFVQTKGKKTIDNFMTQAQAELDAAMKDSLSNIRASITDQGFTLLWHHLPFHDEFSRFTKEDKVAYFDAINNGDFMKFRRVFLRGHKRKI